MITNGKVGRDSNIIKYLTYPVEIIFNPLPWQKLGLQYTASGYGNKIPTSKMAVIEGKKYRIYCRIFSNVGTCFINFQGRLVIFNLGENFND